MAGRLGLLLLLCVVAFVFAFLALSQEPGWAENRSYSTTCAEEDNINVPLFRPSIQRFWIIATHPHYCPCPYDGCPADFSGCPPDGGPVTEIPYKIWDDGVNVVEVVVVSPWWRPYEMNVTVNGHSQSGHYLRLYRKITGEASWPQVLVLYEDGNMRIKPHPPSGVSDICFGSSVIVGPAVQGRRPYIDIQTVNICPGPNSVELAITYRDGQSSQANFWVDRSQAIVEVRANYSTTVDIPFAVFRSMWVSDGKSDVDRVKCAKAVLPILTGWTTLEGFWWTFYREVDSTHNRSAPDITVVIDTPAVFRLERASGSIFAEGAFYGTGFHSGSADVAEWVRVGELVEPGDVLEIDPNKPGFYRKARGPCSTLVAGVVSTSPGFVLGHGPDTEGKAPLALIGIVPVKVTAEGGPIQPGDLLVVSFTPGYAMRWNPESGEPCGLVGKALESLYMYNGSGVIMVLLMR